MGLTSNNSMTLTFPLPHLKGHYRYYLILAEFQTVEGRVLRYVQLRRMPLPYTQSGIILQITVLTFSE